MNGIFPSDPRNYRSRSKTSDHKSSEASSDEESMNGRCIRTLNRYDIIIITLK